MKRSVLTYWFLSVFASLCMLTDAQSYYPTLKDKSSVTIVITDSGLGGIDVMDKISEALQASQYYRKVNLYFVNALFNEAFGYNSLPDRQQKIDQFSKVLYGIENQINPDIILVGCNTLSVLLEETDFVKNRSLPTVGIVEPGVNLILDKLKDQSNAAVIIAGTETTITEAPHMKSLLKSGIPKNSIIPQACPELQSYIERDPSGDDTNMLIAFYLEEAYSSMQEKFDSLYLSLNCSHFGYAREGWLEAADMLGIGLAGILNPNDEMIEYVIPKNPESRFRQTRIKYRVYSKIELQNRNSIASFFSSKSPEIASALQSYQLVPDLF